MRKVPLENVVEVKVVVVSGTDSTGETAERLEVRNTVSAAALEQAKSSIQEFVEAERSNRNEDDAAAGDTLQESRRRVPKVLLASKLAALLKRKWDALPLITRPILTPVRERG